jgi:heptosyltransferase I
LPTNGRVPELKGLFIRLDKIGDLVSTIPCDEVLPKGVECTWMISKGLGTILDFSDPKRSWVEYDKYFSFSQFYFFLSFLKKNKFDFAISFQASWWVNCAMWLARVPCRFGVLSHWHHFLFLSDGLRQRRSRAIQHEADYNFDLVLGAGDRIKMSFADSSTPVLKLLAPKVWTKPSQFQKYFIVHPGMAGSARNWPQEKYIQLIERLLTTTDLHCVLTGTQADEDYLKDIKRYFGNQQRFHLLQNQLNMKELLDCLDQSEFVIAPSTGVLHLAASLSKKTIGIYSPILVQHPTRWKARGQDVTTLVPPVKCPAKRKCLMHACADYDCMNLISIDDVVAKL